MIPLRVFIGFDKRQPVAFQVAAHSVWKNTDRVSIERLTLEGIPGFKRTGLTEFTYSRFLVPWLCGFRGHAIFADASDMLMLGDVAELDALFDEAPNVAERHGALDLDFLVRGPLA